MKDLKEKRKQGFIACFSGTSTTLITKQRRPEQRTASDQDLSEDEQGTNRPPFENKQTRATRNTASSNRNDKQKHK